MAYYIVTVINNYLLVASNCTNEDENADENEKSKSPTSINEPFLSKYALDKLNESMVYVVYLLAVLKSFHENFKLVSNLFKVSSYYLVIYIMNYF